MHLLQHPELVEKQKKAYAERLIADFQGGHAALREAAGKAAGSANGSAPASALRKR